MDANQVIVLGTGGTIAGRGAGAGGDLNYRAGEVPVDALLGGIPLPAGVAVLAEQVAQVDSKDMAFGVWQALAVRCRHWLEQPQVRAVVVTHGTDTLEETAWFLQRVLSPAKPVVITCAMRPATALAPDGPQNLADAFTVAALPQATGVLAVCAGTVHGAADVRKVHPYRLDAFSSGDAGPVARVEAEQVRMLRPWPQPQPAPGLFDRVVAAREWPWVEVIGNHAGSDARVVDALLAAGVQGLVVAGTGNGTVGQPLEAALVSARARGVRVVRSTRCAEGPVIAHADDVLPAHPSTPARSRVDLLLDLLG